MYFLNLSSLEDFEIQINVRRSRIKFESKNHDNERLRPLITSFEIKRHAEEADEFKLSDQVASEYMTA